MMKKNQETHYQASNPVIDGTPIRDLTNATHISDLIEFTQQQDVKGFRKLLALLPDFVGCLIAFTIMVGFPFFLIAFLALSSERFHFSLSAFIPALAPYLISVFAIEVVISAILVFRDHKKKTTLYARLTTRHPQLKVIAQQALANPKTDSNIFQKAFDTERILLLKMENDKFDEAVAIREKNLRENFDKLKQENQWSRERELGLATGTLLELSSKKKQKEGKKTSIEIQDTIRAKA